MIEDYKEVIMINNYLIAFLIAIVPIVISAAAFVVSFMTYKEKRPRMKIIIKEAVFAMARSALSGLSSERAATINHVLGKGIIEYDMASRKRLVVIRFRVYNDSSAPIAIMNISLMLGFMRLSPSLLPKEELSKYNYEYLDYFETIKTTSYSVASDPFDNPLSVMLSRSEDDFPFTLAPYGIKEFTAHFCPTSQYYKNMQHVVDRLPAILKSHYLSLNGNATLEIEASHRKEKRSINVKTYRNKRYSEKEKLVDEDEQASFTLPPIDPKYTDNQTGIRFRKRK